MGKLKSLLDYRPLTGVGLPGGRVFRTGRVPVSCAHGNEFQIRTPGRRRYRTVWLSDIHLGTRGCNADALLAFLREMDCDTLYLVGDIVDGWKLKRSWYWPQSHNDIVQKILRKVRKGTRVIFVPGNHDECLRDYTGHEFGGIHLEREAIHHTADGRRLLVIHGDEFDGIVRYAKWLALVGDYAYRAALSMNIAFNALRRRLGLPYWSLSAYLKLKVKNAVSFISDFERVVAREAKRRGVDGVVCGHIHHAAMRTIEGVEYYNDGDWVESCTALVEHSNGRMEILYCADPNRRDATTVTGAATELAGTCSEPQNLTTRG